MQQDVTYKDTKKELLVNLSGEIDHHTAKVYRTKIDAALFEKHPEVLRLDFSEVKFMDSSGIGLIIGRSEICESLGCRVEITGLTGTMRKVVMLSGIKRLKNISLV
jgi:stage II sporulation protein AA (anti-sigma F factor antagonist)